MVKGNSEEARSSCEGRGQCGADKTSLYDELGEYFFEINKNYN